jgi:hypothetical protein
LGEVHYWKPYKLPNPESERLREEMRLHAGKDTKFQQWVPTTDVLGLEQRYQAIKERLEAYLRKQ